MMSPLRKRGKTPIGRLSLMDLSINEEPVESDFLREVRLASDHIDPNHYDDTDFDYLLDYDDDQLKTVINAA